MKKIETLNGLILELVKIQEIYRDIKVCVISPGSDIFSVVGVSIEKVNITSKPLKNGKTKEHIEQICNEFSEIEDSKNSTDVVMISLN